MQTGQRAYTQEEGLNYLLFLPSTYKKAELPPWPLLVFLHGIAKRGDTEEELEKIKFDGPPRIVEEETDFPFVLLSPQCPSDLRWTDVLDQLDILITTVQNNYSIDPERIYLTGLSMGGFGAWRFALQDPQRFAALVPVAGGYIFEQKEVPDQICTLKDLPIWVFHGALDDVVEPWQAAILVEELRICPGNVQYTLYPDADHAASWKQAYADPSLYTWLLKQRQLE